MQNANSLCCRRLQLGTRRAQLTASLLQQQLGPGHHDCRCVVQNPRKLVLVCGCLSVGKHGSSAPGLTVVYEDCISCMGCGHAPGRVACCVICWLVQALNMQSSLCTFTAPVLCCSQACKAGRGCAGQLLPRQGFHATFSCP